MTLVDFAPRDQKICNSGPKPLVVVNPDALTPDEREHLRRDGFDVPERKASR